MFKQEVPTIGLSIQQGTGSVPDDGRFHVVVGGDVVFSSRARSAALTHYRSLRDDLLRKARVERRTPDPDETRRRERQFYDFQAVMSESMRQRTLRAKRRGGKGGLLVVGGEVVVAATLLDDQVFKLFPRRLLAVW